MKSIFVSSTFKDMQYERDALRDRVLPAINAEARKHGQTVDLCDLRWGVNTADLPEDDASRKVLDVCFDEIDRSSSPMIVLLGDRYGWVPDESTVKRTSEQYNLLLDDWFTSCTALEVEFGPFARGKEAFFYYRHIVEKSYRPYKSSAGSLPENFEYTNLPRDYLPEDEAHQKRLKQLKRRIADTFGTRIREYTVEWDQGKPTAESMAHFARLVEDDLLASLRVEWKVLDRQEPIERIIENQWSYIIEKSKLCVARQSTLKTIMGLIERNQEPVVVKGTVGSGKSTLFSKTAVMLESIGWTVLPFVGGLNSESNDGLDIIRNTTLFLERKLGINSPYSFGAKQENEALGIGTNSQTIDDMREQMNDLCRQYAVNGKKLIIMVDAVDQLFDDECRNELRFVPDCLGPSIRFFMTSLTEFPTPGKQFIELKPIGPVEKKLVIDSMLTQHRRELHVSVINAMVHAKGSDNPLFLSLLMQRLLIMGLDDFFAMRGKGRRADAVIDRQLEIVRSSPPSLEELSVALINEAGGRINPALAHRTMDFIAASRYGLRVSDLSALMKEEWDALDFAHLINYLNECFTVRDDGRIDFMHKSMRNGIRSQIIEEKRLHEEIFLHLDGLPDNDPVRTREILFHCMRVGRRNDFADLVSDFANRNTGEHDLGQYESALDCVRDCCLLDHGKWLEEEVAFCRENLYDHSVSLFVSAVCTKLLSSESELLIAKSIQEENALLAESIVVRDWLKETPHQDGRINYWTCLLAFNQLASVYYYLGGSNRLRDLAARLDLVERAGGKQYVDEQLLADNTRVTLIRMLVESLEREDVDAGIYLSESWLGEHPLADYRISTESLVERGLDLFTSERTPLSANKQADIIEEARRWDAQRMGEAYIGRYLALSEGYLNRSATTGGLDDLKRARECFEPIEKLLQHMSSREWYVDPIPPLHVDPDRELLQFKFFSAYTRGVLSELKALSHLIKAQIDETVSNEQAESLFENECYEAIRQFEIAAKTNIDTNSAIGNLAMCYWMLGEHFERTDNRIMREESRASEAACLQSLGSENIFHKRFISPAKRASSLLDSQGQLRS